MEPFFLLNRRTMARVADATKQTLEKRKDLTPQPSAVGLGPSGWFWVELLGDVAAPTNGWTAPTRGYAKIMAPDPGSTDDPVHFKEFGTGTISNATNASPIVITSPRHSLRPGRPIFVKGVLGNTGANGFFVVGAVTSTTFELKGSTGTGAFTSGGNWYVAVPWTNRDPSLSATAGAIGKVEFAFGEWSLKWVSC